MSKHGCCFVALVLLGLVSGALCSSNEPTAALVEVATETGVEIHALDALTHLAAAGVKFEGEEHRSICREALREANLWFANTMRVRIDSLTVRKQQESVGNDEVRIDVFVDGAPFDSMTLSMGTGHIWSVHKEYEVRDSFKVVVWEADYGHRGISKDRDDLIGVYEPSLAELKSLSSPTIQSLTGEGAQYEIKITPVSTTRPLATRIKGKSGGAHVIHFLDLRCDTKASYVTSDSVYLQVSADSGAAEKFARESMSAGQVWFTDLYFGFDSSLNIKLFNKGVSAAGYSVTSDTLLAEFNIVNEDHRLFTFSRAGQYRLFTEPVRTKTPPEMHEFAQAATAVKQVMLNNVPFTVSMADVCALAGDFFAGVPETDAIGYDQGSRTERSEADKKKTFKKVFEAWYDNNAVGANVMLRNLLQQFELERNAIARHKNRRGLSAARAYSEQDSPIGGLSLQHVTNAHNNNFARIMLGQAPNINYYVSAETMGYATSGLSNSLFYRNAGRNFDHFLEGYADKVYFAGHSVAIETAFQASKATGETRKQLMRKAFAQEGHCLHFGSDLFSGGHQRTAKRTLWEDRHLPNVTGLTGCGADPKGDSNIGVCAAIFHDEDGDMGIFVANSHDEWRAYGDRQYHNAGHEKGRKQAAEFVKESIKDIVETLKGSCNSVENCINKAKTRSRNAMSFLPYFTKAKQRSHPPVFIKRAGRWYYRFVPPFNMSLTEATLNAAQPTAALLTSYTLNWDCQELVTPFSTASSINSRFKAKLAVSAQVLQKEEELMRMYFDIMDKNRDRSVTLLEFKSWLESNVDALKNAENNEVKALYVTKFFQRYTVLNKQVITIDDFDSCLSYANGQTFQLTIRQFAITAFNQIIAESEQTGSRSPRFAQRYMGDRSLSPSRDRLNQVAQGRCNISVLPTVDFCKMQSKMGKVSRGKKLKEMTEHDFKMQAKALKQFKALTDDSLEGLLRYLHAEKLELDRKQRIAYVERTDTREIQDIVSDAQVGFWVSMAVISSMDPTPQAQNPDSPEQRFVSSISREALESVKENIRQSLADSRLASITNKEARKGVVFEKLSRVGQTYVASRDVCIDVGGNCKNKKGTTRERDSATATREQTNPNSTPNKGAPPNNGGRNGGNNGGRNGGSNGGNSRKPPAAIV